MLRVRSGNALGALYMAAGSVAAVFNDGLVRVAIEDGLDPYQAVFVRSTLATTILVVLARARGGSFQRQWMSRPMVVRIVAEGLGVALFFIALAKVDFANVQSILMAVPLVVTLVAARRGEQVSGPQYLLVLIGFIGVIAVMRPTPQSFSPWSLLVAGTALTIVVREFATQRIDADVSPLSIAALTSVAITSMVGVMSFATGWAALSVHAVVVLVLACLCLIATYLFMVQAVRVGDLSVSAPFRYTTVVGAVGLGAGVFGEVPDRLTVVGCVLIVVAGVMSQRAGRRPPISGTGPLPSTREFPAD